MFDFKALALVIAIVCIHIPAHTEAVFTPEEHGLIAANIIFDGWDYIKPETPKGLSTQMYILSKNGGEKAVVIGHISPLTVEEIAELRSLDAENKKMVLDNFKDGILGNEKNTVIRETFDPDAPVDVLETAYEQRRENGDVIQGVFKVSIYDKSVLLIACISGFVDPEIDNELVAIYEAIRPMKGEDGQAAEE